MACSRKRHKCTGFLKDNKNRSLNSFLKISGQVDLKTLNLGFTTKQSMAKIDPKKLKAQLKANNARKSKADDLKKNLGDSGIGRTPRGRGRSAVLPEITKAKPTEFLMVPVDQIIPNKYQPRQDFDENALKELARSIEEFGLIQPITVKADEKGESFQLISGERRWRASKLAGLEVIPAYIRKPNDQELAEMALVENLFREDLNPIEVAMTYSRLMEEFQLTQEELASRVESARTSITNFLRLLKLGDYAQQQVRDGKVSMGHAKALAGIPNVVIQRQICEQITKKELSVRATEALVKQYKEGAKSPAKSKADSRKKSLSPEYQKALDQLKGRLGSGKVRLELKGRGKGQIIIPFHTDDELTDLLDHLDD